MQDNPIRSIEEASNSEISRAYQKCAGIARRAAGNFYYAFIFLPKNRRNAIYSLYAFLRAGDDVTDVESSGKHILLDNVMQTLDRCYQGLYTDDLSLALAKSIRIFGFPKVHFEDMFKGLQSDLIVNRYLTFDELRLYCYRVASTVGLLCLKIFGADTEQARQYAENLGIAMQLTNILRDLKEDLDRNRIYLPREDLEKFGLHDEALFEEKNSDKLRALIHWEIQRAEDFFRAAHDSFPLVLKRKLLAAQIMGGIYQQILQRIKLAKRYDQRIELSRKEKLTVGYNILTDNG